MGVITMTVGIPMVRLVQRGLTLRFATARLPCFFKINRKYARNFPIRLAIGAAVGGGLSRNNIATGR